MFAFYLSIDCANLSYQGNTLRNYELCCTFPLCAMGIITNDQAAGLVDTALLEELNWPVLGPKRSGDAATFRLVSIGEIAGGCFCCRSESLVEALGRLTTESQPEVFLAEPVGSCTDLVATVTLP